MDSFFATANNLDQLLDDLEEDECETEVKRDPTPEIKKPSTDTVSFNASSSTGDNTTTLHGTKLPSITRTQNNNILISSNTDVDAFDVKKDIIPNGDNSNFVPQKSSEPSVESIKSAMSNGLLISTGSVYSSPENHLNGNAVSLPGVEKFLNQIDEAEKVDNNFTNNDRTVDQAMQVPSNAETDTSCADFVVIEKANTAEIQDAISSSDVDVEASESTASPTEPSVVFEKSNDPHEKQDAVSNSDLIMEVFGAIPASNFNASKDTDSTSVPSGIFSPSNPFRDDYQTHTSEVEKYGEATSGIFSFDTGQNELVKDDSKMMPSVGPISVVQSNTNPFYSDFFRAASDQSQNVSSLKNTMQKMDDKMQAPSNIEALPTSGTQTLPYDLAGEKSFSLENEAVGDSFETSMHANTSPALKSNNVSSQQQFVMVDKPSNRESIDESHSKEELKQNSTFESYSGIVVSNAPSKPQIFEQSEQDIPRSELIVTQSRADVVQTTQEKQERTSVGFMKEVAVMEGEFQKFWEMELENDVSNEHETAKVESAKGNINSESGKSQTKTIAVSDVHLSNVKTSDQPENAPTSISSAPVILHNEEQYVDVASIINHTTNPQERQSQNGDTNIDNGAVDISCIPNDALISDSEFEQFLELEANENTQITSNVDSAINATTDVNHVANNSRTTPVSIPVNSVASENTLFSISDDQQGSPTFPLPSSITQRSQVVNGNDNVQPEQRLSLDVEGSREREENSVSRYPENPPPPYTQEMHASYERSFSPTPEELLAAQHDVEQSQQHVQTPGEVASPNDGSDLSGLPSSILESITRPGDTEPTWVRDQDAPQCSNCGMKFSFTKRRHHCRACGRVFCASCCSEKENLKYKKEARVCIMCSLAIKQADAIAATMAQRAQQRAITQQQPELPTPVAEEASEAILDAATVSGENEASSSNPTDATLPVAVANHPVQESVQHSNAIAGVTEEGATAKTPGSKSVRFSDGTRPKHPDEMPSTPPLPSRVNRVRKRYSYQKDANGIAGYELPPIIIAHGENGEYAVKENPDVKMVSDLLESEEQRPQSFFLNPNLIIHIKFLIHADRQCWCFWSEGMVGVGQKEVVLILERQGPEDRMISHDAFALFVCIFERARKGKIFNTMDFMPRTMLSIEEDDELFDVKDTAGFLFVQASSQPLDGLSCLKRRNTHIANDQNSAQDDNLPIRSMLFAILVQRTEAPWATLFPMRLMLRLGMETKQYPCPLFSVRGRQPVYSELGHTILAILCDFRNFKYKVVSVPGLRVVVTTNGTVSVQIPSNRFSDTMKIMNSSNESVLAIGTGTFGPKFRPKEEMTSLSDCPCDSHFVCVQDQQNSTYHTEIINMEGVEALNTGAAFVIFNGSLKSDGYHQVKCAIVEDGIMIQLLPEKMELLRASLKSMEDFKLPIGPIPPPEDPEGSSVDGPFVEVKWVEDDTAFNIGMFSPIDGTPFEGVVGFNVQGKSEQKGKKYILRWNQVFFLASTSNPLDMSRLAEQVANGCFLALTGVLHELVRHRQQKIAIRVTIHPENVGYVAGSELRDLPTACMNALDDNLIQTIHNAAAHVPVEQEAVIIELLFSILLSKPAYRTP